ncbi:MAG: TolC family protein [candidate division Zixibacteria bacterium]|nr:TolC family protein [candidate division Zixibacteria bacterium]
MKSVVDLFGLDTKMPALVAGMSCLLLFPGGLRAREISLEEAVAAAVGQSDRGRIIEGDLQVAQQEYSARRLNFILPEISINGQVPSYGVTESFRFFGGGKEKEFIKTTDLDFTSNIRLNQNLLTGGDLTVVANLLRKEAAYPLSGVDVDETSRQGVFDFTFEQPLLKPSEPKNELNNRRDDLEIACLVREEELAKLKKEVTEAYFGVLQTELKTEITGDKLESARLQSHIDSAKFVEAVISEESWLESSSSRLDAELEKFDIDNQRLEKQRDLALLLDLDVNESFSAAIPSVPTHLTEVQRERYVRDWEDCAPLKKARYEYDKQQRAADYAAGGHGLTGSLTANYSLGRGKVDVTGYPKRDNNTDSWGLSLNFSLPLWDGGSSAAAVKAAHMLAERAKIEYEKVEKAARAEIVNLINGLDVSFRKLGVLDKQVELSKNRMDIAKFRMDDGQISVIAYLATKITYLEARDKYLEELKNYLIDKIELESKYID